MEDIIINFGSAVKSLDGGKIGGYLVRFGKPDLAGDFFTKETDFGFEGSKSTPVFLNHRLPFKSPNGKMLRVKERIGEATLTKDDDGILIEAILYNRKRYEAALAKMGWSSGTANWLVDREKVGKAFHIKMWPLGADASLTWEPCDPGNSCMPLKSFAAATGIDFDAEDIEEFKSFEPVDDDSFFEPIEDETKNIGEEWTQEYINNLPDAAFAYVEPGGEYDGMGRTRPRSHRHFPYKNADGHFDEERVREALSRIPQANIIEEAKQSSLAIIRRAAKTLGIEVESGKSMTFTDHFLSVVTAVEEHAKTAGGLIEDVETLSNRIRNRLEFREAKDGRTISAAHRERLNQTAGDLEALITALKSVQAEITGLTEMARPKPKLDPETEQRMATEAAISEAAKFEAWQFERATRPR